MFGADFFLLDLCSVTPRSQHWWANFTLWSWSRFFAICVLITTFFPLDGQKWQLRGTAPGFSNRVFQINSENVRSRRATVTFAQVRQAGLCACSRLRFSAPQRIWLRKPVFGAEVFLQICSRWTLALSIDGRASLYGQCPEMLPMCVLITTFFPPDVIQQKCGNVQACTWSLRNCWNLCPHAHYVVISVHTKNTKYLFFHRTYFVWKNKNIYIYLYIHIYIYMAASH